MRTRRSAPGARRAALRAAAAATILFAAIVPLRAEDRLASSPGFVDGSAFADLAGEDGEITEINLSGQLLRTIASVDAEDQGFGDLVRNLKSISAYIVELGSDAAKIEKAARLVRDIEARLERQSWERIARVREKTSNVNVWIRSSEPHIDGLVVLVLDRDGGSVVFANIAGRIDLARLGELGRRLDVPGLEGLGEETGAGKRAGPKSKREKPDREDAP